MVYFLKRNRYDFPDPSEAEADGLIAVSSDIHAMRIAEAYARGIFPWIERRGLYYWFSPDPRMVLLPSAFRCSKSLQRTLKSGRFEVRRDTCFAEVIRACANTERSDKEGTWITPSIQEAYCTLHSYGIAHSFETFYDGRLVGGLYGVSLGDVFYGESMFHTMTDASKVAFAKMVEFCRLHGFRLIDAQQETAHLASLGAQPMSRAAFSQMLSASPLERTLSYRWSQHTAVLLLGSNMGDRVAMLSEAFDALHRGTGFSLIKSSIYESEPWGFDSEQAFLNQAVVLDTELSATELLHSLKAIERSMGRQHEGPDNWREPTRRYQPRTIDIDIIFYDGETIETDELSVPHPRMAERRFVLTPLNDVCPGMLHPRLKKEVRQLLAECKDTGQVTLYQQIDS